MGPSHFGPSRSQTLRRFFLSRDAKVQMRRTHQSKARQESEDEETVQGKEESSEEEEEEEDDDDDDLRREKASFPSVQTSPLF